VLAGFRRRICERFLKPVRELARHDKEDVLPLRPGFAILALDCLLIDTIQSFREGRVTTGEVSPAASFRAFLKSPRFPGFNANDRDDFFDYIRNGLLHNGETRKDWKIRIDTRRLLVKAPGSKARTLNRRLFHAAVVREFRSLCQDIKTGSVETRTRFLRRMDAICGLQVPPLANYYFAYGSNLLRSEITRDAGESEEVGVAFLPGFRLAFAKHSVIRGGDAATIRADSASMVWGYLYRMHNDDRRRLREREKGYRELPNPDSSSSLTVYLTSPDREQPIPVKAFTFIAESECSKGCGPSQHYLSLVIEGGKSRVLPEDYVTAIENQHK
jgi:hypothetical protein